MMQMGQGLAELHSQAAFLRGQPDRVDERIALCQQALTLVNPGQQPELWAQWHAECGLAWRDGFLAGEEGYADEAIRRLRIARDKFAALGRRDVWAAMQVNLASVYRQLDRGRRSYWLEQALAGYETARDTFHALGIDSEWVTACQGLADVYLRRLEGSPRDNVGAAIACCREALAVLDRARHPIPWANLQRSLGLAHQKSCWGDVAVHIEQALGCYQQAIPVLEKGRQTRALAAAYHQMGETYLARVRGNRAENARRAVDCFTTALRLRPRHTQPVLWAETTLRLAVAYLQFPEVFGIGKLEEARLLCEEAQGTLAGTEQTLLTMRATLSLGNAYMLRVEGERAVNIQRAMALYCGVIRASRRTRACAERVFALHDLAIAFSERLEGHRQSNLLRAYNLAATSMGGISKDDLFAWANAVTDMVDIAWKLARAMPSGDAQQDLLDSVIVQGKKVIQALSPEGPSKRLALAHYNLGNAEGDHPGPHRAEHQRLAIDHYQHAVAFFEQEGYLLPAADTHNNLGVSYMEYEEQQGDEQAQAATHLMRAQQLGERIGLPVGVRRAARNLGNLYFAQRDWASAHEAYEGGLRAGKLLLEQAYTEPGRQAEIAEISQLHARAAYCLCHLGRYDEAWQVLEEGKARLLAEALSLGDVDLASLPDPLREGIRHARERVRAAEASLRMAGETAGIPFDLALADEIQAARAELGRKIRAAREQDAEFMPEGLDVAGTLAIIPDRTALVAPFVTADGSMAFVIPQGCQRITSVNVVPLPHFSEETLRRMIFSDGAPGWQKAMVQPGLLRDVLDSHARQLWDTLIGPIHDRLRGLCVDRLIILPQGGLQLLPLHAAWRIEGGVNRYLADDYEISYAPSAFALNICQRRAAEQQGHNALVVNALQNMGGDILTRIEAMATLLGTKARPEAQLSKEGVIRDVPMMAQVLFACHGIYDWESPLQSHLDLGSAGKLSVAEIMGSTNASQVIRLVTLLACETGLSDILRSPDEYIGLPVAFLRVRAAGVLSSLWPVSAESATMMIERFYRNCCVEGMTPAAALHAAQRWLREQTMSGFLPLYDHPYHWASFTVTGV